MMTVFDYYQGTLFFLLLALLLIISVIRSTAEKPAGGFALLSSILTAAFAFAGKADQACWLLISLAWYLGHIFWRSAEGVFVAMLLSQMLQSSVMLVVLLKANWTRFAMHHRRTAHTAARTPT